MEKNCRLKNNIKIYTGGFTFPKKIKTYANEIIENNAKKKGTNLFIPNFKTTVPFIKVENPTEAAKAANM